MTDDTVLLRHDGRARVIGGPADLGATHPDEVVIVDAGDADHYIEHHGFVAVDESEAIPEMSFQELRRLAGETEDVNGNQSATDLRDQLLEHYG